MEPKRKNFSANFAMDEMTSHRLSMPNFYILKIHISDKIRKRDDYFFLKEIRDRETCASYPGTNYSSFNALKDIVLRRWQNLFLHWLLNFSQLERLGIPGGGGQPRPQGFSLKKWVGPHPFFKGKALGTRLTPTPWDTQSF